MASAASSIVPQSPPKRARFEDTDSASHIEPPPVPPPPTPTATHTHSDHPSYADSEHSDHDTDLSTLACSYAFFEWHRVYSAVENGQVIKKDLDELSKADLIKYAKEVHEAQLAELMSFVDLHAIRLGKKGESGNLMTSRWVLRFKLKDNVKIIKARLTVHGFKDADADHLSTFAGTATKWSQRLVPSIASNMRWELLSADVSSAFIRGLTFEEMSKLTGSEVRTAAFSVPKTSEYLIKLLPGFEAYDSSVHEIIMLKPIYGLKDAPRAWRQKLHQVLTGLHGRSLASDPSLYTWHELVKGQPDPELRLIVSTHVDDLKITGTPAAIKYLVDGLISCFGKLTIKKKIFEHCGI